MRTGRIGIIKPREEKALGSLSVYEEGMERDFLPELVVTKGNVFKLQELIQMGYTEEFFNDEGCGKTLEQAAQKSCGYFIPGSFQGQLGALRNLIQSKMFLPVVGGVDQLICEGPF